MSVPWFALIFFPILFLLILYLIVKMLISGSIQPQWRIPFLLSDNDEITSIDDEETMRRERRHYHLILGFYIYMEFVSIVATVILFQTFLK